MKKQKHKYLTRKASATLRKFWDLLGDRSETELSQQEHPTIQLQKGLSYKTPLGPGVIFSIGTVLDPKKRTFELKMEFLVFDDRTPKNRDGRFQAIPVSLHDDVDKIYESSTALTVGAVREFFPTYQKAHASTAAGFLRALVQLGYVPKARRKIAAPKSRMTILSNRTKLLFLELVKGVTLTSGVFVNSRGNNAMKIRMIVEYPTTTNGTVQSLELTNYRTGDPFPPDMGIALIDSKIPGQSAMERITIFPMWAYLDLAGREDSIQFDGNDDMKVVPELNVKHCKLLEAWLNQLEMDGYSCSVEKGN